MEHVFVSMGIFAVVLFVIQLVLNLKCKKTIVKLQPIIAATVLGVVNLAYYLYGVGTYDYSDLLTWREAVALSNAILLAGAVAGMFIAGIVTLVIKRMKEK